MCATMSMPAAHTKASVHEGEPFTDECAQSVNREGEAGSDECAQRVHEGELFTDECAQRVLSLIHI